MERKINVGIIGQGRSGLKIHADCLAALPELFTIGAVADPLAERCAHAAEKFGCRAFQDYRRLLECRDLELVVNTAPSHLHVPITSETLAAGFHTLCEKPLARTVAEVDRLAADAAAARRRLAVFQQRRFSAVFQRLRALLATGVFGRVIMIQLHFNNFSRRWDWQTLRDHCGGALLNTGPHVLDQALQFFGTDLMPAVSCQMDRVNTAGDAEDHVRVTLSGPGRPTIDIQISSCCAFPTPVYRVLGACGGLEGDHASLRWRWFDPAQVPDRPLERAPLAGQVYCREELPWQEESWQAPAAVTPAATPEALFYRNLYQALRHDAPLAVTLDEIRQQVAVIEDCHRRPPSAG